MFTLATAQPPNNFVNCPRHRNNKKKYKLSNQQIFDRNNRTLKSFWSTGTKKEYHPKKYIKSKE